LGMIYEKFYDRRQLFKFDIKEIKNDLDG